MTEQAQPKFIIQKIYTKDMSFETPNAPDVFKIQWQPKVNVNIDTSSKSLDNNVHEVDLTLTLTVKNDERNAYLIEVTQSGIFTIENMPAEQLDAMLGAYCPNTLFPYIKEAIDSVINRGGFPQINMAPINFDAIYMQKKSQQTENNTQH